jgi:streptogramin lyase
MERSLPTIFENPLWIGLVSRKYACHLYRPVDNKDIVWLSDFGVNATLRSDPKTDRFTVLKSTSRNARVRQIPGRPGVVRFGVGADKLVVLRE